MVQLCVVVPSEQDEKNLKTIDTLVTGKFLLQHINYGFSCRWTSHRRCRISNRAQRVFHHSDIYALPESVKTSEETPEHPIHVWTHHLAAALQVRAFTLQGKT